MPYQNWVVFTIVLLLGIAGNARAYKLAKFREPTPWFWNVVWVVVLTMLWPT